MIPHVAKERAPFPKNKQFQVKTFLFFFTMLWQVQTFAERISSGTRSVLPHEKSVVRAKFFYPPWNCMEKSEKKAPFGFYIYAQPYFIFTHQIKLIFTPVTFLIWIRTQRRRDVTHHGPQTSLQSEGQIIEEED